MKKFIAFAQTRIMPARFTADSLERVFEDVLEYRLYDSPEEFTADERKLLLERRSPNTVNKVLLYEINALDDVLELNYVEGFEYMVSASYRYWMLTEDEVKLIVNGESVYDLENRLDVASNWLEPLLVDKKPDRFNTGKSIPLTRFVAVFTEYTFMCGKERIKSNTFNFVVQRKIFTRTDKNGLVGEPSNFLQWRMLDPKVKMMYSIDVSPSFTITKQIPELKGSR